MMSTIAACGKNGDSVTNDTAINQQVDSSSNVPHAQVLLTQLEELRTTVYFSEQSYDLTSDGQLLIDPVAVRLRQHPDSYVVVIGHSDDFTSEEDNIALSYERAFSVAIYISSVFGVEEERIQIVAAGDTEPLQGSSSALQNKRVEIVSPKAVVRTLNPNRNQQQF
ncbi:OmpA family protein [Photobacterium sanctipauli]|nr:OmpA family protein [Photobacterium sanctipauli]